MKLNRIEFDQLTTTLMGNVFQNILRKTEIAGKQHFLFFPIIFSILSHTNLKIIANSTLCSVQDPFNPFPGEKF